MSIELIGRWLQAYGVQNFQGACAFRYQDQIDFTVEISQDEESVVLHSVVGEVSDGSDSAILRRLLQRNYLGKETSGATLALDGTGRNVTLWIALPIPLLDVEQFEASIGSFLDLSERLFAEIIGRDEAAC